MATELWLDHALNNIVFEGRNKRYGAYALRISYDLNMTRGMIAGILLFIFIIISPMVLKTMKNLLKLNLHRKNKYLDLVCFFLCFLCFRLTFLNFLRIYFYFCIYYSTVAYGCTKCFCTAC